MTAPFTTVLAPVEVKAESDVRIPTLPEFLAWVRSAGLQKGNRFFVDMTMPNELANGSGYKGQKKLDTMLACEEIAMLPRSIQTRTVRLGGLDERRASSLNYGGEFTLTFLVDNTHDIQFLFERWMNVAVGQTSHEVGEYADYATTVDLWFLRPFHMSEAYNPLSRRASGGTGFLDQVKERVMNIAAAEVGAFMTKAKNSLETYKQTALGKNLQTYNRIKGALPLEALFQQERGPTDMHVYRISFKEAFPVAISRTNLHQGMNDVYRISVQFAFKEYTTSGSETTEQTNDSNIVMDFLRKTGIPLTKSRLANEAINLL